MNHKTIEFIREQEHDLVRFIYGLYPMHLLDKNEMTYQRY